MTWIPETRRLGTLLVGLGVLLLLPTMASAGPASEQLEFGVTMAKRGLWSEALFRFQQAERLEPANSRVLNNLAVAYEANGMFEKALEAYQKALKTDPGSRDLKENYSRFVEFYQSFKAQPAEAAEGGEEGAPEPQPEPEPEPGPAREGDGR